MIKVNVITSNNNWYRTIKNQSKFIKRKIDKINTFAKTFLKNNIYCTLLLYGNKEIKNLNKTFIKKNKSTEVS